MAATLGAVPRPPRPRGRLDPTVGKARAMVGGLLGLKTTGKKRQVEEPPLILVGCSGGPDSLALAAVCAFFAHRGEVRVGAVVVDHQMQAGSAAVAQRTAAQLETMGLDPVVVRAVHLKDDGAGPEGAARAARFAALDAAAQELGAKHVLLGHTMDDQAESVLLGLARGSGTRSLAGMRERRGIYLRPFLGLRRDETLAICAALDLDPWHDPANQDPAYLRVRVRHNVIPQLAAGLGPGVAESLARSATILGHDADLLDDLAAAKYHQLAQVSAENGALDSICLPEEELRQLPPALRTRVLALAAVELGGVQPSLERLAAVQTLLLRKGSAGPVQLAGKVSAWRISRAQGVPQEGRGYGKLVLRRSS